jgi:hypothetical protein
MAQTKMLGAIVTMRGLGDTSWMDAKHPLHGMKDGDEVTVVSIHREGGESRYDLLRADGRIINNMPSDMFLVKALKETK